MLDLICQLFILLDEPIYEAINSVVRVPDLSYAHLAGTDAFYVFRL